MEGIAPASGLISFCVPVYNAGAFIKETLRCLCSQDYPYFEIIVVDDGSTDDSRRQIEAIADKRVTLLCTQNGGAAMARNVAYRNSKGAYVIFFDADDIVPPCYLRKMIQKITEKSVVMARWGRFYNNDLSSYAPETLHKKEMDFLEWIGYYWKNGNSMTNPGRALIPRSLIDEAGGWNESLSLNDDFEFFTRIFLCANKIILNDEALFYYRSGVNGLSAGKSDKAYRSYYNSVALSLEKVFKRYGNEAALLKSCANIWQLFIYSAYPHEPELVKMAEEEIKNLGGASLPFPSGKLTSLLAKFVGWKLAMKTRLYFRAFTT